MSISDLIVVMKDGVIQQIGKPQAVYDDPANLFVAKFLGNPQINVFDASVKGGRLLIGGDAVLDVPGVPDGPVHAGVRPEGFVPAEEGALRCQLRGVEVMGRDVSVLAAHPAAQAPTVRAIVSADISRHISPPAAGVRFTLLPHKVFLFDRDTEVRIPFGTEAGA